MTSKHGNLEIRLSATTAAPIAVMMFYILVFMAVPLFATRVGSPVPIDKLACVLIAPVSLLGLLRSLRAKKLFPYLLFGYLAVVTISSVSRLATESGTTYPLAAPLLGILGDLKPFAFVFCLYEVLSRSLCNREKGMALTIRVLVAIAALNGVFVVRDMLFGGTSVWGIRLSSGIFGLWVADGLFNHKTACACLTMIGVLGSLALIRDRLTIIRISAFIALLTLLILNNAAKETLAVLLASAIFALAPAGCSGGRQLRGRTAIAIVLLLVVASALPFISSLTAQRYKSYAVEASVRGALHTASMSVANDLFPLGSGAGTFASMPSRDVSYSPLYYKYGIFALYMGGPNDGTFLLDVWWPHVIAEGGWCGFVFYAAIILYALIRLGIRYRKRGDGTSFFLLASSAALVITSVAAPTFTMDTLQPLIGLVWGSSMLDTAQSKHQQTADDVSNRPSYIIDRGEGNPSLP